MPKYRGAPANLEGVNAADKMATEMDIPVEKAEEGKRNVMKGTDASTRRITDETQSQFTQMVREAQAQQQNSEQQ